MRYFFTSLPAFLLTLYTLIFTSSMELYSQDNPPSSIPIDSSIKIGKLSNGLTYYIRANEKPEQRAELRLVIKAGSVLETEEQRGLAHFVEHMNFKGSQHFSHTEMINYLESIGTQFGADLNAYTSFDHTVYSLYLPIDQEEIVDKGFLILSDWAARATLATEAIESERAVIYDELCRRQGARQRITDEWFKVVLKDSLYSQRLPIGLDKVVLHCDPDLIRQFYKTWYRPELMAVVAVGNFNDIDHIEKLIQHHFSSIPSSEPLSPPLPVNSIPEHDLLRILIQQDLEAAHTALMITHFQPPKTIKDLTDYQQQLTDELFYEMLSNRLEELRERPDGLLLGISTGSTQMIDPIQLDFLKIVVPEGKVLESFKALLIELKRIEKHGFTEAELKRAKANKLAEYEHFYLNISKTESAQFAIDSINHFLFNHPIPDAEWVYLHAKDLFEKIELKDFTAQVQQFMLGKNQSLAIEMPSKGHILPPTESDIQSIITQVGQIEVIPYSESPIHQQLFTKVIPSSTITSKQFHEGLGLTEINYHNGIKVFLKPTDFAKDQIFINGVARGGKSSFTLDEQPSVILSTLIASESGWGNFSPIEQEKILAGKDVHVYESLEPYVRTMGGRCRSADIEEQLQLLYLHFTDMNYRSEGFDRALRKAGESIRNRLKDPVTVFRDRVTAINTQGHPFFVPLDENKLQQVSHQRSYEVYQHCFSNPSDFTFFLIGDFDLKQIEPLINSYLGSIPSSRGAPFSDFKCVETQFPTGKVQENVYSGIDKKSMTQLSFPIDNLSTEEETLLLQIACQLLQKKLLQVLRTDMSGTYSTSVGVKQLVPATHQGSTYIIFSSAPDNIESLVSAVWKTIEQLQDQGPQAEDLQAIKAIEKRHCETGLKDNRYWTNYLSYYSLKKWPLENILSQMQKVDAITAEQLKDTFQRFFKKDRYTQVSLLPAQGI